ncbi:hypothetical protein CF392_11785 [Tamilnaduibacter salinus]|uniref:Uncharacterized protein n=1 Tax=Tamilnaduibacter salinus TaxID=1484056 RepID=A0A2A2I0U7_9GAMM|nr:hypothetical protein [Tamilnaduibacter salinus]PAV25277.1 hypothetical protein CF392_11785 [Tamilnaduibacter salinus]
MSEIVKCGLCHYEFEHGARVCQGCQGTVVYGATGAESSEGFKVGALTWGVLTLLVFYGAPLLLNHQFDLNISVGWGLGIWALVPAAIAAFWGGFRGSASVDQAKEGLVRTYRRM